MTEHPLAWPLPGPCWQAAGLVMPSSRHPTVEEETWVAASPHSPPTQWPFSESLASHRFLSVPLNLVCVCVHVHAQVRMRGHVHI